MKINSLTFRLEPEEKDALMAISQAEDVPAGQIMRRLVGDWLKDQQAKAEKARHKGKI
jgi:hypothetical protein